MKCWREIKNEDKHKAYSIEIYNQFKMEGEFSSIDVSENYQGLFLCGIMKDTKHIKCQWENYIKNNTVTHNSVITFLQVSTNDDVYCGITESFELKCYTKENQKTIYDSLFIGQKFIGVSLGNELSAAITENYQILFWKKSGEPITKFDPPFVLKEHKFYSISCLDDSCCAITFKSIGKCWYLYEPLSLKSPTNAKNLMNVLQLQVGRSSSDCKVNFATLRNKNQYDNGDFWGGGGRTHVDNNGNYFKFGDKIPDIKMLQNPYPLRNYIFFLFFK